MPTVSLSERQQGALRTLLATEPIPGRPLPRADVLETLGEIVPCDGLGAVLVDGDYRTVDWVNVARGFDSWLEPDAALGPLYLGVMHWSRAPAAAAACGALEGNTDAVAVGFRNGSDHVAQVFLSRERHVFSERDLATRARCASTSSTSTAGSV